jgi:hypothetical protein
MILDRRNERPFLKRGLASQLPNKANRSPSELKPPYRCMLLTAAPGRQLSPLVSIGLYSSAGREVFSGQETIAARGLRICTGTVDSESASAGHVGQLRIPGGRRTFSHQGAMALNRSSSLYLSLSGILPAADARSGLNQISCPEIDVAWRHIAGSFLGKPAWKLQGKTLARRQPINARLATSASV